MKKKILLDKVKFVLNICRVLICFPLGCLLYLIKDIYIICERGTDARDNGYHFYKYMVENHPERNVYYIIDENSADYEKVALLGRVIDYKSWKHILYFVAARKKISSHFMGYAPGAPHRFQKLQRYLKVPGKHIFLQHGVIGNNVVGLHADKACIDLFICGARPEYEFVKNVFGHPESVVCYTGLARHDNLHGHITKRDILIMPTWRKYLSNLDNEEFMRSDYYCRWNEVLHNQRLLAMLQEHQLRLIFYPHYEMQKFINCFSVDNENVIIAGFDEYDVQQLLIDAKLLITDYSSVFFDFAYMQKPCICYHFDSNDFFTQHYDRGYFDYSKSGFGEVVRNIEQLLCAIKENINHRFSLETKYLERINVFFELHDNHNCERIYQAIEALK